MSQIQDVLLNLKKGRTYADLESLTGINRATLCDAVTGKRLRRSTLNRIHLRLGYPPIGGTIRDLPPATLAWLIQNRREVDETR